jgi:hypothetical protein
MNEKRYFSDDNFVANPFNVATAWRRCKPEEAPRTGEVRNASALSRTLTS